MYFCIFFLFFCLVCVVLLVLASVRSLLRQSPSTDDNDPVTCLHIAGLGLVNSILVQSVHHCDGRGSKCALI